MNMAGLVQFHQGKRHHETDGTPLETPEDRFQHLRQTLARELQRSTSPRWTFSQTLANARAARLATTIARRSSERGVSASHATAQARSRFDRPSKKWGSPHWSRCCGDNAAPNSQIHSSDDFKH